MPPTANSNNSKIIMAVTNDLLTDNRVHKVATFLCSQGASVELVGRCLPESLPLPPTEYKSRRFRLPFRRGVLFYAVYNIRLFIYLIFNKFDVLVANDLDTLPACYMASLCKGKTKALVYDSHEYFTEVPELTRRPLVRRVWQSLEALFLPRVKQAYTVCTSIADIYENKYGVKMKVVRNIPMQSAAILPRPRLIMPAGKKIIIYQGALNVGRGIELVINAMQYIDNAIFMIVGGGDIDRQLRNTVEQLDLADRVTFLGRIPFAQLPAYTRMAQVGISLEQEIGLNYHYALPNKLFDYIHAGIPVLASDLPEIKRIVEHYNTGMITANFGPKSLAEKLNYMLNNAQQRAVWSQNITKAAGELTWEQESRQLEAVYRPLMKNSDQV